MTKTPSLFATTALLIGVAFSAQADEERNERREHGRRGPPLVAIDACAGGAESDACSFEGRRGDQLSGSCEVIREQLACIPEGHHERKRRGCSSLEESR